jgi:photosystem II stability/assembly factor-like uncharacterized protein
MKKITVLFLLLLAIPFTAQEFSMDLVKNYTPRNIGPGGMSGRVTSIDVIHDQPDVMYVGTASGGVWKSTSGGIKWDPIFNKELTASIGAIAIQQSNPSVIWVGTGEGNPRNSLNGGFGVYKSIDGGKNWIAMGLEKTRHIHKIIIDPSNPNTVYIGAIGSPWGEHKERGVYKTTDGGKTWKNILFINNKTGVADLVMDPKNPNKLVAALWEHKREPWFFNSGGEGSGLHITHDGGETWEKRTADDGLPKGNLGRIGLAIAANKPHIIYALIEAKKNALYKSTDGGFKWKKVNDKTDIGNRPFYYSDIFVDPSNENRLYSVFTYVNVSEDGGKNFSSLMPAYGVANGVHPDHHAWYIHPNMPEFMIDGNDGGLNITKDGGKTWRFIGNLPVAQFYHISVDNEIPYNVYGGMQDNGSWRGPAYVWKSQGIRNSYWQEIAFGDGFDVVPDLDDSRYGYAMSQQGFVSRYDHITGNNYSVRPTHPDPELLLRFNWNAAIGQDPFNNSTVYFGSQFVHKSTDKGLTWNIISPDLTTNDPEKLKQHESGGLTMDATGAENHCTILVIEPSPIEQDMLWVATDDGQVHYTQNAGTTWTNVSDNIKGLPAGSWIPQIKASNKNKGEALLIANDYRRFNYTPYAYRTTNYGKTWKRIVDENDVQSYTLSIIQDKQVSNLLFLGTDDGLYVSFDAGEKWTKWTAGFPTVSTKDLAIQERESDLVIGTFGRAAWVLDDIEPLRAIARDQKVLSKKMQLFKPKTAYLASYQQPTGSRFGADALYNAKNRRGGAMISYYIRLDDKKSTAKDQDTTDADKSKKDATKWQDSVVMQVYKSGQLIRTIKRKAPKETGFHKMYWGMNEKGVNSPTRSTKRSKREPRGVGVLPGAYTVKLSYNGTNSEQRLIIEKDPRVAITTAALEERYATQKQLEQYTAASAAIVEQLVESKKTATVLQQQLKAEDAEKYKEAIKASKTILKALEKEIELYLNKEDKRQGIVRSPLPNVSSRIRLANRYVATRNGSLTATEQQLIQQAKSSLETALLSSNAFLNSDWKDYTTAMKELDLPRFKETRLIRIETN